MQLLPISSIKSILILNQDSTGDFRNRLPPAIGQTRNLESALVTFNGVLH